MPVNRATTTPTRAVSDYMSVFEFVKFSDYHKMPFLCDFSKNVKF